MPNSNSSKKWRGRLIRYAPLILWLAVIFINSTTISASSNTSRFVRPLLEWLFPNSPEEIITIYHGYVRKLAHFVEYAVLGFFASRAFWYSSAAILQKYWFFLAFIFGALVASFDEYNQSFNPARTSSIYDVLIDAAGGLFAVAAFFLIKAQREKQK